MKKVVVRAITVGGALAALLLAGGASHRWG